MAEQERAKEVVEGGLVTVKEAAGFLSISVAGVYSLMGRGDLPYVKIGRRRLITRQHLNQFLGIAS